MMVAGRLRSNPTQIVYVEWRCQHSTRGKSYFYVDADRSTEPLNLSDIFDDTIPAEIILRSPITLSDTMFEEGAARLWDTHLDICANQWARKFDEANVDEFKVKKGDENKDMKKERLSDAQVQKYIARYDRTKKTLSARDFALAMRALGQRHPDGPGPHQKILLECRRWPSFPECTSPQISMMSSGTSRAFAPSARLNSLETKSMARSGGAFTLSEGYFPAMGASPQSAGAGVPEKSGHNTLIGKRGERKEICLHSSIVSDLQYYRHHMLLIDELQSDVPG